MTIDNSKRGARTLTGQRIGEWHGKVKHSDETVREARRLYNTVRNYRKVGEALGVHWRTVSDWVKGYTRWSA